MNNFIEFVDCMGKTCYRVLNDTPKDIADAEKAALSNGYFVKSTYSSIDSTGISYPILVLSQIE